MNPPSKSQTCARLALLPLIIAGGVVSSAAPMQVERVTGRANRPPGTTLEPGESLFSGKNALVLMSMDQGKAAVGSDTELTPRGANEVELRRGTSLLSTRRGGNATMSTTESNISVKGTMQVAYMPGAYMKVTCLSGKVRLKLRSGSNDAVTLRPGQMVFFQLPSVKLPDPIDVDLKQMVATSSLAQASLPNMPGATDVSQSVARQQKDIASGKLASTNVSMAGGAPIAEFDDVTTGEIDGAPRNELPFAAFGSGVELRNRNIRRASLRLRADSLLLDNARISVPAIPDDPATPHNEGEVNLAIRNWQIIRNNSLIEGRQVINYVGDFNFDLNDSAEGVSNTRENLALRGTLPVAVINSTVSATEIVDLWVRDTQARQTVDISGSTVGTEIRGPDGGRINGYPQGFDTDLRFTSARAHSDLVNGPRSTDTIWIWNENVLPDSAGNLVAGIDITNSLIGGLDTRHLNIFAADSGVRIGNSLLEADLSFSPRPGEVPPVDADGEVQGDLAGLLVIDGKWVGATGSRLWAADKIEITGREAVAIIGGTKLDATLSGDSTATEGGISLRSTEGSILIEDSEILAERAIDVAAPADITVQNTLVQSRTQADYDGLVTFSGQSGNFLRSTLYTFDELLLDFGGSVLIQDSVLDSTIASGTQAPTGSTRVFGTDLTITNSELFATRDNELDATNRTEIDFSHIDGENLQLKGREVIIRNSRPTAEDSSGLHMTKNIDIAGTDAGGARSDIEIFNSQLESSEAGTIHIHTPNVADARVVVSSSELRSLINGQPGGMIDISSAGSLELINNTMTADVIKATSFGPGGLTVTGGTYDAPTMLQFYAENGHNLTFRGAVDVRSNDARFAGRTVQVDSGGAVNVTGNVRVFRDVDNYNKVGFGTINATGTRGDLPYDTRPR